MGKNLKTKNSYETSYLNCHDCKDIPNTKENEKDGSIKNLIKRLMRNVCISTNYAWSSL